MKKVDEDLMIYKWCMYLREMMGDIGTKGISVDALITFALANPNLPISPNFCTSLEDGLVWATKAVESIKKGGYPLLKYDEKRDAIRLQDLQFDFNVPDVQ